MKLKRRSVSISGETYNRLSEEAEKSGKTRSGIIEELLVHYLENKNTPIPPNKQQPSNGRPLDGGGIFTF